MSQTFLKLKAELHVERKWKKHKDRIIPILKRVESRVGLLRWRERRRKLYALFVMFGNG